jgi:peptidoglycan/LPS O-acetylase OafA/YrhL
MLRVENAEPVPFAEQPAPKNSPPSQRGYFRTNVYYRPELDALRFLAFGLVFIHHLPFGRTSLMNIKQGGAFGLPIFFCLSAYLIVTLLLKEKDRTGTVRLRWFAARRMLRIWPLYFGILALGWVLGRIWPEIYLSGKQIAFFTVMLGNVWMLRHGWMGSPAGVVWSISIEEQFYLGIPFLIRAGGRRAIAICCFAALVVAYVALIWIHLRGENPEVAPWSNSFVQFQYFGAGGLLALIYERWQLRFSFRVRAALFAVSFVAFGVAAPILVTNSLKSVMAAYFLGLIGTTGILVATLYFPLRSPSPLVYLGRISYGLYVFHSTVLWFVFGSAFPRVQEYTLAHRYQGTTLALVLIILCASASYRFIEGPILRLKDRFAVVHSSSRESRMSRDY